MQEQNVSSLPWLFWSLFSSAHNEGHSSILTTTSLHPSHPNGKCHFQESQCSCHSGLCEALTDCLAKSSICCNICSINSFLQWHLFRPSSQNINTALCEGHLFLLHRSIDPWRPDPTPHRHFAFILAYPLSSEKNKGGGGNSGEGKTYHKSPPQKRFWTPPPLIRFPPPC